MNLLRLFLFVALAVPSMSRSENSVNQYSAVGESCIKTQEPGACMEANGFRCHWNRMPNRSVDAYMLGCNATLSDGRRTFVQILFDGVGWNVESEETYLPEPVKADESTDDPYSILSAYIREEIRNYQMHSGGAVISDHMSEPLYVEVGTRRQDGDLIMRAVCGVIVDGEANEAVSFLTKSACEKKVLRAIMMLSQPRDTSPYRAAGAADIEWQSRTVTLASSDIGFVIEGRYTFAKSHAPCLWMSDCCSRNGRAYLDSCRSPTDSEMDAVKSCLAEGLRRRSEEFSDCLRDVGVKVGCDEQANGSRICY